MLQDDAVDILVIGAGVAGMAAAKAAAAVGLKVCVAEEAMFGGLAVNVNHLDPAPAGLPESGSDLAADMMVALSDLGVDVAMEPVAGFAPIAGGGFEVRMPGGARVARMVIVATGATLRKLGVPGEAEFEHRGVSHCADCDAPLYRGQSVVVVGGGDSAVQESLVLAEFCETVHLVHRGSGFTARPDLVARLQGAPRVHVHLGTVVESLEGTQALAAVRLRGVDTGETRLLPCTGFFAYVGLQPRIESLPPEVEITQGAVRVDGHMESTLANVFAIGAARAGCGGTLSDAMDDARTAIAVIGARLA